MNPTQPLKYEIRADYVTTKTLEVTVISGADPENPNNWIEVLHETDEDCQLQEVRSSERIRG